MSCAIDTQQRFFDWSWKLAPTLLNQSCTILEPIILVFPPFRSFASDLWWVLIGSLEFYFGQNCSLYFGLGHITWVLAKNKRLDTRNGHKTPSKGQRNHQKIFSELIFWSTWKGTLPSTPRNFRRQFRNRYHHCHRIFSLRKLWRKPQNRSTFQHWIFHCHLQT